VKTGEKIKILYIDDEQNNLNGFKATFRFDYTVYIASNTAIAYEFLRDHNDISVVLCDQRMPDKTGVQLLIGGVAALDNWTSVPVVSGAGGELTLKAEEPSWYALPDRNLAALFRDNSGSKILYRAFSTDNGRTWSTPVKTDFPDARSKLHAIRLKYGRYALVSNSNPL
jgi:hypothetical protein